MRLSISLAGAAAWMLCLAAPASLAYAFPFVASAPDSVCAASLLRQDTLHLEDGRLAYTAATSETSGKEGLLLLGTPAFAFPRHGPHRGDPQLKDSLIGLVVRSRGASQPVLTPLREGYTLFPRGAAAARGGWYVLFVQSAHRDDDVMRAADSASIWFGHFSHGGWKDVTRIASTFGGRLRPEYSSRLLSTPAGDLAFAYALDGSSGTHGVVVLRRVAATWYSDTIPSKTRVDYVSLEAGSAVGQWSMVFRKNFVNGPVHLPGSLFVTVYDGAWRPPQLVIRTRSRSVNSPQLLRRGPALYVSWSQDEDESLLGIASSIRFARIDAAPSNAADAVIVARDAAEAAIVALGDRYLWLIRDQRSVDRILLKLGNAGDIKDLGTLMITHETGISAFARDSQNVMVVTTTVSRRGGEESVASLVSEIRVTCHH